MKRVLACVVFVPSLLGACSKKLEGPTPAVTGVLPAAVCQAQISTVVELSGSGLSPLVTGALKDRQLELPQVSLTRVQDVAGAAVMSMPVLVPDDPLSPSTSHVRWASQEKMSFDVYPALALETGLYDIGILNASGQQGAFPAALLAVPPPTITKIEPDLLCGHKANTFALTGDFFIQAKTGASKPRVAVGDKKFDPATMEDCRDLPGTAGLQACKKLTVALPMGALAVGVHAVSVENPAPVGCASKEAIKLTIVPEPTLAAVEPDLVCTAEGDNAVMLTGTNFLTVNGVAPKLRFASAGKTITLDTTAAGCTAVAGPAGTVQSCTSLTATLPKDALPPSLYEAVVTNPPPADCATEQKVTYVVAPPPVITSVQPDFGCAADGPVSLTINGTGFLTVGGAVPEVTIGTTKVIPLATGCTAIMGTKKDAKTCTALAVVLPKDTPDGVLAVVVKNPATAACSSKEARTFTVVRPPTITAVEPETVCAADGAVTVSVKGTNFLTVEGMVPEVSAGALKLVPKPKNCAKVEGPAGNVQACTELSVSIPKDTAPASLMVAVKNPAPAACVASWGKPFTVVDRPVITAVMPDALCGQSSQQTITITGNGFLTVGTSVPTVKIGAQTYAQPTLAGCVAVAGKTEATQLCTSLTVTAPANTFAVGQHPVSVQNPAPAACGSVGTSVFEVVSPPTLTAVAPGTVCAGSASLDLTGDNFGVNAKVLVASTPATTVTVAGDRKSATADFAAGLPVGGPYDVTIQNAVGCQASLAAQVRVVAGPQVFFVDPPVAYNGITTQATLYGAGFTGDVKSVSLVPAAGGAAIPITFTLDVARPNQAQILIPSGTPAGEYDLELHDTTACAAVLVKGLTITDQKTLALAASPLLPAFGWMNAGTATTVSASAAGSGFAAVPRVYLNPMNPGPGTVATALGAVTFVDRNTLTALVRGLPAGKYDVIVVNPDGKVGVATAAFEVTTAAPPSIDSLTPGSVTNRNPETFVISGTDFRSPKVTLTCLDGTGAPLASSPAAMVTGSTDKSVNVSFDASLAGTACIVRVTNGDNNTYADHSALVITNPAQNLYAAKPGPELIIARRAPVMLAGNASSAARYVHVLGGDNGAGLATDAVETSALSLLGAPASPFVQRNKLKQARTLAGGVQIGRFLYMVGGSGGTPLATVERAAILDPKARGEVTDLALDLDDASGVGPGTWYYRVAPVLKATDAFNPGGEDLASDPFPVRLPALAAKKFHVTVKWKADARAEKYRIYRSPTAGATVGTEQLLAEVNAPGTSYKDTGAAPVSGENPLPVGSLGQWQTLAATMAAKREGAGVVSAPDPADATKVHLYALGGRPAAGMALASYEFLTITVGADGSQTPAASFTAGTNALAQARWQLGAVRAGRDMSTRIAAGANFIYALSGLDANGAAASETAAALVKAGGQLDAWTALKSMNAAGYVPFVAGDFVYSFGGSNAAPDNKVVSGEICGSGVSGCGPAAKQVPPNISNWNAGQTMLTPRYLMGGALSGAFIYVAGGVSVAGTPGTITKSIEYRLW